MPDWGLAITYAVVCGFGIYIDFKFNPIRWVAIVVAIVWTIMWVWFFSELFR